MQLNTLKANFYGDQWKLIHDVYREVFSMEMARRICEYLMENLRLKTYPLAVSFLERSDELQVDFKAPSKKGMKITVCQGISWVRFYNWRVLLGKDDINCVPAGLAFGLMRSKKTDTADALAKIMMEAGWVKGSISDSFFVLNGKFSAIFMEPLIEISRIPDVVLVFCEPAQIARLLQAYSYVYGNKASVKLSGRLACSEYLIQPFIKQEAVVSIPGAGDRIFSGIQDYELAFSAPYSIFSSIIEGLEYAGAKIKTNRYPFPLYMFHEVKFPFVYDKIKKELEIE